MICSWCRQGGKLNSAFMDTQDKCDAEEARDYHDRCKGGTQCDCQHVVGRTAKAGREPK